MNIKIRFKGTYLGFSWTAIEPTLTFIILYIVFTTIRFSDRENYGIYLLTGVFLFHIFTRGTLGGLTSLRSNRGILESLNIRKEFFPVVATASTTLLIFIEVAVFFALMPFFNFIPPWTVVFLPAILALLILLILGFSYILSVIHVYFQDIHPFWGIITHSLFFISPVFWYLKDVNGILLEFHKINPVGQLIELAHQVVVFGTVPDISDWAYSIIFVAIVVIFGYALFQKFEDKIVQEL